MADTIQLYSLTEDAAFVCCHFYCVTDYQRVKFSASSLNCYHFMMFTTSPHHFCGAENQEIYARSPFYVSYILNTTAK
jgi:hypothetical protein